MIVWVFLTPLKYNPLNPAAISKYTLENFGSRIVYNQCFSKVCIGMEFVRGGALVEMSFSQILSP